jgi:hypothetical protein
MSIHSCICRSQRVHERSCRTLTKLKQGS